MKHVLEELNIPETAFVGDLLSTILSGLKDLINASRGANPDIPAALKEYKDKFSKKDAEEVDEDGNPKIIRKYGRWYENPKYKPDGSTLDEYEAPEANNQPDPGKNIQNIKLQHQKTLQNMQQKIKKLTQHVKQAQVKVKKQAKQAKPTSKPISGPTRKQAPANPQPLQYTAKRTVPIKVMINGKIATTTIKKGTNYALVKTSRGIQLKRRGQRGMVFVAPSQLSLLH